MNFLAGSFELSASKPRATSMEGSRDSSERGWGAACVLRFWGAITESGIALGWSCQAHQPGFFQESLEEPFQKKDDRMRKEETPKKRGKGGASFLMKTLLAKFPNNKTLISKLELISWLSRVRQTVCCASSRTVHGRFQAPIWAVVGSCGPLIIASWLDAAT